MNELQKQTVYGTMLGDAHIRFPASRSRNALLRINHCMEQLDYLSFICGILKPYSRKIKYQDIPMQILNGHVPKARRICYFYTDSLPVFTNLHRIFYVGGVKIIPESVMQSLSWQGLAIWIADDGSYVHNTHRTNSEGIGICSQSFTRKDNLMAMKQLKKNFMLGCWYSERENKIYINNKSLYRMRSYAMPLLPKLMWYKFGVDVFETKNVSGGDQTTLKKYCDMEAVRHRNNTRERHQ